MSTDEPVATSVFTYPFQYWVGMDTDPRTTPEALAEFNRFYSCTHVFEVIAGHPGFVTAQRFELAEPDPRGGPHAGPRWLAIYGMADEASAERYVKDNERPWLHRRKYSPWPPARKKAKTVWRMLWRQLSASDAVPESFALTGTKTPPSDHGVAQFELYREFVHPAPGGPLFYTVFARESATDVSDSDAIWRLVYRHID